MLKMTLTLKAQDGTFGFGDKADVLLDFLRQATPNHAGEILEDHAIVVRLPVDRVRKCEHLAWVKAPGPPFFLYQLCEYGFQHQAGKFECLCVCETDLMGLG